MESLVAPELAKLPTAEEYLAALPSFDAAFKERFEAAAAKGEAPHYAAPSYPRDPAPSFARCCGM